MLKYTMRWGWWLSEGCGSVEPRPTSSTQSSLSTVTMVTRSTSVLTTSTATLTATSSPTVRNRRQSCRAWCTQWLMISVIVSKWLARASPHQVHHAQWTSRHERTATKRKQIKTHNIMLHTKRINSLFSSSFKRSCHYFNWKLNWRRKYVFGHIVIIFSVDQLWASCKKYQPTCWMLCPHWDSISCKKLHNKSNFFYFKSR